MNGITKITVNGKPVGLRFAYPTVRWFSEACLTNKEAFFLPAEDNEVADFSIEGMAKLIQCSYWNECLVKEQPRDPELNYEAFVNFVEEKAETEEGRKELADIIILYADSSISKKMVAEQKKSLLNNQPETNNSTLTDSNLSVTENSGSGPGS